MNAMWNAKCILVALLIGLAFGVALGILNGGTAVWIAVGGLVGLAYGVVMSRRGRPHAAARNNGIEVKE